jgi:hypothetical protein
LDKLVFILGEPRRQQMTGKRTIKKESEDNSGAYVSVDQLVSTQPGLVPQISGQLTSAQIWAATVFLDYITRHVYVHLMRDQTQASTLEKESSYECHANTFDVSIQ